MQQLAAPGVGEQRAERRQIAQPDAVDEGDLAGDGQLDDAQAWPVGPLEDELGVERDVGRRSLPTGDSIGEGLGTIDPGGGGRHVVARVPSLVSRIRSSVTKIPGAAPGSQGAKSEFIGDT